MKEMKRDQVEQRLVLIENIPEGEPTLVANELARALRSSDATVRVDPSQIFIGLDPSKEPINEPPSALAAPTPQHSKDGSSKRKSSAAVPFFPSKPSVDVFTMKNAGDDSGIFYYLGDLAKAERGEQKWLNPIDTNYLTITSSSTDSSSDPISILTGRQEGKRFATKDQTKQWIQIQFNGYVCGLKKYTIRHTGSGSKNEAMRSWKIEGSMDGHSWKLIDERKNLATIANKNEHYAFEVKLPPPTGPATPSSGQPKPDQFTHFRLTSTGPNSGNTNQLALGGIEFYGQLKKQAEKPKPFPTPFYAILPLASVAMKEQTAAPKGSLSARQIIYNAIGQVTMPLHIKPPKVATSESTLSSSQSMELAQPSPSLSDSPAPSSSSRPSPSPSPSAIASSSAASSSNSGGSRHKSKSSISSPVPSKSGGGGGKNLRSPAGGVSGDSKEDLHARQRQSDDRRRRLEEDRRQRAEKQRLEEIAREEASRHVLLHPTPIDALPNRQKHPLMNAFIRSKLVEAIQVELNSPSTTASSTKPTVKSWGQYIPTQSFRTVVTELIRRHGGPISETLSLSGQLALDEHSLQQFLAYAKFDSNPVLEKEVALMRKQASLPTGIECDLIIQILCRIAGAPAVKITNPILDSESAAIKVAVPAPEYQYGASLVMEWIQEAGYDINLQRHVEPTLELGMATQHSSYWTKTHSHDVNLSATDYQPLSGEKFVDFLHDLADRLGEQDILTLQPTQICLAEEDWNNIIIHDPCDGGNHNKPLLPLSSLRLRYTFLRLFNRLFSTLLPLIDLRRTLDPRSIAGLVGRCRPFVFPSVKNKFISNILDTTAEEAKTPTITVNRLALQLARNRGETIDFMRDSLFAKTFHQLYHKVDPFHLRPVRPHGTEPWLAFETKFKGEQVVGEGGPYRQLFTDLGKELMEHSTLLQPTPNNTAKIGNGRDKYLIQPSANTSQQLQFFEFLGMLFGCCLRTGVRFPLELSDFTWKQILEEDLTLADLYNIDQSSVDSMRFIEATNDAEALDSIQQTFTTKLSDGSVVELKPNGGNIFVDMTNKSEYVGLVVAARLTESVTQVDAIRRGLGKIIPIQLLHLLTSTDLSTLICGRTLIDIDLLRRHTKYSEVDPNAAHIQYLWEVLQEFDQTQRKAFIKFCWAAES